MSSRVKEDERIEKIIRGLLKLPENRRCINCNSLGPQYVCATFLTFVCTNCSGIHREFTHRVKSVSMAKFNAEEVNALQAAGNERARQIYFRGWDPHRHSFPDGSNLYKLRDFIKHVYVDRKYTSEKNTETLPRLKLTDKEDSSKNNDMQDRGSASTGRKDEKSVKYYYDERRSPRYAKENNRYGALKRNPARFEVVDDRVRDDGSGSGRKSRGHKLSNVEIAQGQKSTGSTDGFKNIVVRHVSDLLGENVPRLQVDKLPNHTNHPKDTDGSSSNLKIVPVSNEKSADINPVEQKSEKTESLIDFNTSPELHESVPLPHSQKEYLSTNSGDGTSFGFSAMENTLESLLFQLIVPPPAGEMVMPELVQGVGESTAITSNDLLMSNEGDAVPDTSGIVPTSPNNSDDNTSQITNGQLTLVQQNQCPASSVVDFSSSAQHASSSVGALDIQLWDSSPASNVDTIPATVSLEQSSEDVSKPANNIMEVKSNERKELPLDLFTAMYSAQVPHWQSTQHHVMGYGMQYHPAAQHMPPALPNPATSTNPFDINSGTNQATMFPSVTSMQEAVSRVSAPTGSNSMHAPYLSTMPQQSSPSYASAISPGVYMDQQGLSSNISPGFGSSGSAGANFSSFDTNQYSNGRNTAVTSPNSFPLGGNPFG